MAPYSLMHTIARSLFFILFASRVSAQVSLYSTNHIQKIEIQFSQANWDYQMDTAMIGSETYLLADWIKINGEQLDSVGVKYKGNSSYDSTRIKNPLNIALDEFVDQKYQGFTNIKLSNGYGDPSFIREVLAYNILNNYMHCPRANFAQVYINGNYIGLYASAENINKKWCADHFYSSDGSFFKCNPLSNPGPTTKSNFKYLGMDSSLYESLYEIKSNDGWYDLINLCQTATNNTSAIESVLDMDRMIWMLAFNQVMLNLDSYSGVFAQNHYTYKDQTGHFNPIVWDLNMCFGAFPFAGLGNTSMGSLTVSGMQNYSPWDHQADPNWPLINIVLNDASYKKRYVAHCKTILSDFINNGLYETMSTQYQTLIDTAVQSDSHKLFSYTDFQGAMNNNTTFGSYTIPGISTLMNARNSYLNGLSEFGANQPIIAAPQFSPAQPTFGSTFIINSNIGGAQSAWLAYRFDTRLKFVKTPLFDDGAHNDGASGDGVFGTDLSMNGTQIEYYIYAENNDAAAFLPARAEHEFYLLRAAHQEPQATQLVINELLADNVGLQKDEYRNTEDWIELYNNTGTTLNLDNLYLSDDNNQWMKWKFPTNSAIAPNAFFMIWADDDSLEKLFHTNFNLSKDSGKLFLSHASGILLDSITYGAQTTNVSYGRYPNGTGNFSPMNTTYGSWNNNDPLSLPLSVNKSIFRVYPNPTSGSITIQCQGEQNFVLMDIGGRPIWSARVNEQINVSMHGLAPGIYFLKSGQTVQKISVIR